MFVIRGGAVVSIFLQRATLELYRRHQGDQFQQLLSCLVEGNQLWAKDAPVLDLGIISHKFVRNGEDNRAAIHDLGLASGNLVTEATARGLCVHH
jgi:hypothetical protein